MYPCAVSRQSRIFAPYTVTLAFGIQLSHASAVCSSSLVLDELRHGEAVAN